MLISKVIGSEKRKSLSATVKPNVVKGFPPSLSSVTIMKSSGTELT